MRPALGPACLASLLALGLPADGWGGGYRPDPRFEHIAVEEGLPAASVTRILQDHLGFLWLGTPNGLVKYDGYTFTTYKPDPDDPSSISGRAVMALHEDSAGDLWIGTRRGGLDKLDRATETFIHFRHDPDDPRSLSFESVGAILEDASGVLWIGTGDVESGAGGGGLNRFDGFAEDGVTGTFTHFRHDPDDPTSLSHDAVSAIHEDREGRLWVTTPYAGLNLLDRAATGRAATGRAATGRAATGGEAGTFTRFRHDADEPRSLASDYISAICEGQDGSLWIGTWGRGLLRFDPQKGMVAQYRHDPEDPSTLGNDHVLSVFADGGGKLWIGTWGGLLHSLDPEAGKVVRYEHDPGDPTSFSDSSGVMATLEDRAGIMWFGTWGGGLNKLDRYADKFLHIRHEPGERQSLVHRRVGVIHRDRAGRLWIGTEGGIDRFDPASEDVVTFVHDPEDAGSLSDNSILSIHEDSSGVVWIGTKHGGLNRWDPEAKAFTHFRHDRKDPSSLSSDGVSAILEDSSGELWIGTGGKGLNRLDRAATGRAAGTFTHYRHDPEDPRSLSHDWINSLYEDSAGTLWLGTEAGLDRLDRDSGEFTRYFSPVYGLEIVYGFHEDAAGRFWVATATGGLHLFDRETGTSEALTEKHGLANDSVLAIQEDGSGHLWLSTAGGVSKLDPDARTFRTYGVKDGLQRQLSHGAGSSSDGTLLFAGTDGINAIHPGHVADNPHPPPVALTDFKIFDRSVRPGPDAELATDVSVADEITVAHRQNVISFEFAGLHFGHPEANRYAYRLDPFSWDWTETDAYNRQATYTNLSPGRYEFQVRAANSDGVWNEDVAAIVLHVEPPWWQTWWAYGSYGLLALGLIFSADRLQRSRLVRRERERARRQETQLRAEAAELQVRAAEAQAVLLQAENDRKTQELDEARRLQLSMLPETVPWHPEVEIAALMKTATEVGGDYYDFDIADDGTLTLAIGDATGHGTAAGIMVTATKSLFHLLADEPDVVKVLKSSTRALKRMRLEKLYMALALAKLKDGVLDVASAGMPPALVHRAGSGIVEEIAVDGMPLGGQIRFPYEQRSVSLEPGDTVVFMSDGLAEMADGEGELFGYERIEAALSEVAHGSPQEVIDHFVSLAEAWTDGSAQDDDMTFVVMKVKDD